MNYFSSNSERGLLLAAGLLLSALANSAADSVSFNRDIRPILSDKCYACHGPDKNARKGKFRLDLEAEAKARRDEHFPIVSGQPAASGLVKRIFATDPDEVMPPPKSNSQLTPREKELLKQWIAEGAKYEAHWAYLPVTRPTVPSVPGAKSKIENPIDHFLLARQQAAGLTPVAEADRRTLIRRLAFDLTGLPPTAAEVGAFVKSKDAKAYEKLVDRLLDSPRYGERMTVNWLDLVRYADSVGYHGDQIISVWPFRDYVINAFNANVPFDRFTREQLAGDLLTNATPATRIASGYNRLGMMSTEGGIQDKEYLAKYAGDRVRNTSNVWLGATLGCAECHDHKFDPYSTKDFYRFAAFFADLKEKGWYKDGFDKGDWGPQLKAPTPEQQARLDAFDKQIARHTAALAAITDEKLAAGRAAWEAKIRAFDKGQKLTGSNAPAVKAESTAGTKLEVVKDGEILASGPLPAHDDYTVTLPARIEHIAGFKLDVIRDDNLPGNNVSRAGTSFYISEVEVTFTPDKKSRLQPVKISGATADFAEEGHPALATIDGNPRTSWGIGFLPGRSHNTTYTFARTLTGSPDAFFTVRIRHSPDHPRQHLGRFRVSLTAVPADVLTAVQLTGEARKEAHEKTIAKFYRTIAPELEALRSQLNLARAERETLTGKIPVSFVSESTAPRVMRVLARGDWMDDSGEIVESGAPHFLKQIVKPARATRLDLADWMTAPDNPLTARVFVNRLWKMYFGTGLSRNLDDLGAQGEWPQQLDLLDWLSDEFMTGWDVKHLARLMVTSAAYRRSADSTPLLEERDPFNRLLTRQSRHRLDAEFIRDNALAISGLLVEQQGGPSVKPVQPAGYWAYLNFPRREYASDAGDSLHRRGLYTHWQRTFLHPSLLAFDAPTREECTVSRPVSDTPLQALVLLNDPSYIEAARAFAEKILRQGGRGFDKRLAFAFETALARPPKAEEAQVLHDLFEKQWRRYQADKTAARQLLTIEDAPAPKNADPELAAWMQVSRAILNLHETITRE